MHMYLKPLAIALTLFVAAAGNAALAQSSQRIQLSQIEAMFSNMRAKAPWNVDGPLLWDYFFFDPSRTKLEQAAAELQPKGYRIVAIDPVPGRQAFRLHIERVETHTPATLDARNQDFYALAARLGLASYDGMDVGPVGQPAK